MGRRIGRLGIIEQSLIGLELGEVATDVIPDYGQISGREIELDNTVERLFGILAAPSRGAGEQLGQHRPLGSARGTNDQKRANEGQCQDFCCHGFSFSHIS